MLDAGRLAEAGVGVFRAGFADIGVGALGQLGQRIVGGAECRIDPRIERIGQLHQVAVGVVDQAA